jgi:hypothetical protein
MCVLRCVFVCFFVCWLVLAKDLILILILSSLSWEVRRRPLWVRSPRTRNIFNFYHSHDHYVLTAMSTANSTIQAGEPRSVCYSAIETTNHHDAGGLSSHITLFDSEALLENNQITAPLAIE